MPTVRSLLVLAFLCLFFANCKVTKPYATSIDENDSLAGYVHAMKPYYKTRTSPFGVVLNITCVGAGAAGGYLYSSTNVTKTEDNGSGGTRTVADNSMLPVYTAAGAVAGYFIGRLFVLHSHKRHYVKQRDYQSWVTDYNKSKKKDYLFISTPNAVTDTSMTLLPKHMESRFRPQSLYDLRVFTSLFDSSIYIDSAIIAVNPMLTTKELDTLINTYANRGGVYATKVEYIVRSKNEKEFQTLLDKYKEVQNTDTVQQRYAELVETYPFAIDFIGRYPTSSYFDNIYMRMYQKLSWSQLTTAVDLYPANPTEKANKARTIYFEMASTYRDMHNAIAKYPTVPFLVKATDNVSTEDSAKDVLDKLKAYKPLSAVNNLDKVQATIPQEFLTIRNKEIVNADEVEDLYNITSKPWLRTDSSVDIIDEISSRYAKAKGQDKLNGMNKAEGYDTGTLYRKDGVILKGLIRDKKDIVGYGEKIREGVREKGNFDDGQLNGKGVRTMTKSGIIQEGNFKDGRLDGLGKTIHINSYVDSGIFRQDKLDNGGKRVYSNGDQYSGNFYQAKFSGYGTFTWSKSKKSYTGNFAEGKRDGSGELSLDSGYVVKGNWKNDCPDGEAKVLKQVKHNYSTDVESDATWIFKDCNVTEKHEGKGVITLTDADVLEKLPE